MVNIQALKAFPAPHAMPSVLRTQAQYLPAFILPLFRSGLRYSRIRSGHRPSSSSRIATPILLANLHLSETFLQFFVTLRLQVMPHLQSAVPQSVCQSLLAIPPSPVLHTQSGFDRTERLVEHCEGLVDGCVLGSCIHDRPERQADELLKLGQQGVKLGSGGLG